MRATLLTGDFLSISGTANWEKMMLTADSGTAAGVSAGPVYYGAYRLHMRHLNYFVLTQYLIKAFLMINLRKTTPY